MCWGVAVVYVYGIHCALVRLSYVLAVVQLAPGRARC
jgi:hypothetical protein